MIGGVNSILNTARQGLFAQQSAIQLVSQNIANASTDGYTRQRMVFEASRFGDGVSIKSIDRLRDRFLDLQMRDVLSEQGTSSRLVQTLSQAETLLDETDGDGVNSRLSELFASFHDLSSNPDGQAEREAVRSKAGLLLSQLNGNDRRMASLQRDTEAQVVDTVGKINNLANQIADLNTQISGKTGLVNTNELQDKRNLLVEQMSGLIETQAFLDPAGGLTVLVAGGLVLVESGNAFSLQTSPNPQDGGLEVNYVNGGTPPQRITSRVTKGELAGLLQGRQTVMDVRKRMDQFAATLFQEINLVHQGGMGLDGISGRNFFDGLSVFARKEEANTGGADVTASSIVSLGSLTFHDYEIRFTAPGSFDVVDTTTGTTLSSGNAYVSGSPISFDGMSITLTDVSGAPAAGDVFEVNSYTGAAASMTISAPIAASLDAIAAGLSASTGDNENALRLADMETQLLANGGRSTFGESYQGILSDLGLQTNQAKTASNRQELLVEQTRNFVSSLSGVSIDEESLNLIAFQRAFDASARVVGIADELYQSILSMLG